MRKRLRTSPLARFATASGCRATHSWPNVSRRISLRAVAHVGGDMLCSRHSMPASSAVGLSGLSALVSSCTLSGDRCASTCCRAVSNASSYVTSCADRSWPLPPTLPVPTFSSSSSWSTPRSFAVATTSTTDGRRTRCWPFTTRGLPLVWFSSSLPPEALLPSASPLGFTVSPPRTAGVSLASLASVSATTALSCAMHPAHRPRISHVPPSA
mmetsp:Transcript_43083/g.88077  ORF Transcript_43083/g.88077 Transcript_43083/m.88077 type:complete len:212 (-) Transcript_43083:165-800(-)